MEQIFRQKINLFFYLLSTCFASCDQLDWKEVNTLDSHFKGTFYSSSFYSVLENRVPDFKFEITESYFSSTIINEDEILKDEYSIIKKYSADYRRVRLICTDEEGKVYRIILFWEDDGLFMEHSITVNKKEYDFNDPSDWIEINSGKFFKLP